MRKMAAVVNRKTRKVESMWNNKKEAVDHIRHFGMEFNFEITMVSFANRPVTLTYIGQSGKQQRTNQ